MNQSTNAVGMVCATALAVLLVLRRRASTLTLNRKAHGADDAQDSVDIDALSVQYTRGLRTLLPLSHDLHRARHKMTIVAVTTVDGLLEASAVALGACVVGVDLEHSPRSFHGYVCTVQIATPAVTYVIDALVADVRAAIPAQLGPVFASRRVLKVLHAASNDARWLMSNFGTPLRGVCDTSVAAGTLGRHSASLASLLAAYLNVDVDKSLQRADWRQRPLPLALLMYAAEDAWLLLPLAAVLLCELGKRGSAGAPLLADELSASHDVVTRSRYDVAAHEVFDVVAAVRGALRALRTVAPPPSAQIRAVGSSEPFPQWGSIAGVRDSGAATAVRVAVKLLQWRHERALITDTALDDVMPAALVWEIARVTAHAICTIPRDSGTLREDDRTVSHGEDVLVAAVSSVVPTQLVSAIMGCLRGAVSSTGDDSWHRSADALVCEGLVSKVHRRVISSDRRSATTARSHRLIGLPKPRSGSEEWTAFLPSVTASAPAGTNSASLELGTHHSTADPRVARAAAKAKRAVAAFATRAAPLYANIQLYAPDGALLAVIDARKASWYVSARAAVLLDPADADSPAALARSVDVVIPADGSSSAGTSSLIAVPGGSRLRMVRAPRGPGHGTNEIFYVAEKRNECVVCGLPWDADSEKGGTLTRCYIVPHVYRQHFPLAAKSYTHHDIVLTCGRCHHDTDRALALTARTLANEAGVPSTAKEAAARGLLRGQSMLSPSEVAWRSVRNSAVALLAKRGALPQERVATLWTSLCTDVAASGDMIAIGLAARLSEAERMADDVPLSRESDRGAPSQSAADAAPTRRTHRSRSGAHRRPPRPSSHSAAILRLAIEWVDSVKVGRVTGADVPADGIAPSSHAWCVISVLASQPHKLRPSQAPEDAPAVDSPALYDVPAAVVRAVIFGSPNQDTAFLQMQAQRQHRFGDSGLPLEAEARLETFVRTWRVGFLRHVQPRFLPEGWRTDFPLLQADARRSGKSECAIVMDAFRIFNSPNLALLDPMTGKYN